MSLDALDELKNSKLKVLAEAELTQGKQRELLRNYAVALREAGEPAQQGPASLSSPTFKVGEAKGFTGVLEALPRDDTTGHLSKPEYTAMLSKVAEAGQKQDPTSRAAAAGAAAKVVANSWSKQNGHGSHANPSVLKEGRAQVAFATTELVKAAGVPAGHAAVVGYALERAMEKEGFKVLAHHAIDKVADGLGHFKASSSSAALATGNRAQADSMLNKSVDWLASKGVGRDAVQKLVKNHAGKLQIIAELSKNPETIQQVSRAIAKSDSAIDAVLAISKDSELRKALGTLTMAAGESVGSVNKGIGATVLVTGALIKGESADEMGRHVFRMGLSLLGGAAGGIAAGYASAGFGAVAGMAAGQYAGDKLADKVLEVYDKLSGNQASPEFAGHVRQDDISKSKEVLAEKALSTGQAAKQAVTDRVATMSRH